MDKEQKIHDLALAYELLMAVNPDCNIAPEAFLACYDKGVSEFSLLLEDE